MSGLERPLRVVQWTTGNVARQSLASIVDRPDLELVGVYAYSQAKVGRDAGDLAGLGRTLGVAATDDVDALIALAPDCVAYMPLTPNLSEMARLLRAGVNIVTTAEFLTGHALGNGARRTLQAAGEAGGASVFGSGVNPGWIEYLAAVVSGVCRDIERVRVVESFDLGPLAGDGNQADFGWGRPAGDPGHARDVEAAVHEFQDAAQLLATLLGITLDDVRCEVTFAHATRDLELAGPKVARGTVAGIEVTWFGVTDEGRDALELTARWTLTGDLEPAWTVLNGYKIEVRGDPSVQLRLDFLPENLASATMTDFATMGCTLTAMPAVNAIPAVVAAPPGIVTYADLRPMTARLRRGPKQAG